MPGPSRAVSSGTLKQNASSNHDRRNGQGAPDQRPVRLKNFVLDTNVLLHDPKSPFHFEDNNVFIPIEVIEEIDRFKRDSSELGRSARTLSRLLDEARGKGSLSRGIQLETGGHLRILVNPPGNGNREKSVDSRILQQALALRESAPDTPLILVTKDINLRIRADALGLQAEDYETDQVQLSDLYSGIFELTVDADALARFRDAGDLTLEGAARDPGEYCMLINSTNAKQTLLAKVDPSGRRLIHLSDNRDPVWGIRPRNREQHFALDALLDDSVKLVTLMGKAGTGKTLLAMAAGLRKTVVDREYRRVLVARPTISMGKELGFLPGSMEEKLNPWMQPIHDALELLSDLNMGQENRRSADLLHGGMIVVEALSYIRGRSIANQFMMIDEAQNLTPLEVKTIITRAGAGTKIVLTGDPFQIDNPYVDSRSNGFNYLISRMREYPLAAHVELAAGERSELAELAANVL